MLTDREIIKLANDAYNEFLTNFLIECDFELISLNKFLSIAENNVMVQDLIRAKVYNNIKEIAVPVLVVHGELNKVYFCKNILVKLIKRLSKEKQRLFIEAITFHELYHIVNQVENRELNIYNYIKSDKRAHQELKEDYSDLVKILEEVKKRFKVK